MTSVHERLKAQESAITWLHVELLALQKRLARLERQHVDIASWKLKAAYEGADELEQQGEPPPTTGL